MGRMSREKGKVGEREVAELLRSYGFTGAKRGVQFQGGKDSPDVMGLPGYHVEVKRTEQLSLYDALNQADLDSNGGGIPVVFHRKNSKPWVVLMMAGDFLNIVKQKVQ